MTFKRNKYRSSCDACLDCKVKCSQTKPSCSRCSKQGHDCVYSLCRKIGRPPLVQNLELPTRLTKASPTDTIAYLPKSRRDSHHQAAFESPTCRSLSHETSLSFESFRQPSTSTSSCSTSALQSRNSIDETYPGFGGVAVSSSLPNALTFNPEVAQHCYDMTSINYPTYMNHAMSGSYIEPNIAEAMQNALSMAAYVSAGSRAVQLTDEEFHMMCQGQWHDKDMVAQPAFNHPTCETTLQDPSAAHVLTDCFVMPWTYPSYD